LAERKVVFYECQHVEDRPDFDCRAAVANINDLEDDDWRVPDGGSHFAVIVDRKRSEPYKLRLLRIRPDVPFLLNAARELSPAEIARNHSFTEFTWAMIWDDGIMGAVSSRDAPSHKRLSYYFERTSGQVTYVVNLFRPDLAQRLRDMKSRGLRAVQLKVRTSELEQARLDENISGFRQLLNAGKDTEAATIGIELSVGRARNNVALNDDLGLGAEELAEQIDFLESMHVKGFGPDGQVESINVKQERLTVPIEIAGGGQTNAEVYELIEHARQKMEGEIGDFDNAARGT
jgi:hypothetical protein